ncbi:MAG: hypothetical protein ACM3ZE_11395 [Myxococcales bacterium]
MRADRFSGAHSAIEARFEISPGGAARNREWWFALALALLFHLAWQAHGISSGSFQNLDVAGIAYNARLLLAGRLPYVDSVEIKPPGAFLLFAPLLALAGLKAVWWFSVLWGALTSAATGWFGALCWGAKWGPRVVVLHSAGAAIAADGDINYSFWMTLPLVLSAAFSAHARLQPDLKRAAWSWVAASAMGAFAVLIRPSAATAALVYAAALAPLVWQRAWGAVLCAVFSGLVGTLFAIALVAIPFVHGGSIEAVLRGYSSVRQYADESVSAILIGAGGRIPATLNGLTCLPDQLPVCHLLLAVSLLPVANSARTRHSRFNYLAWVFALASLIGISLTLRFFSHDNAPLWAALAVVVARPTGLVGAAIDWCARVRHLELVATAGVGVLAPWSNWQSLTWLQSRLHESDEQVARLCRHLSPHLGAEDTVLAWGWSAWGVYEHCGRWAPGPVYKDLTTVTTPNTNTCNRGYDPPRLKDGPFARQFLHDLEQKRPGLIVISDYYRTLGRDPLDDWTDARRFMRDHYVLYQSTGTFQALLRRDLGSALGLLEGHPAPFPSPTHETAMMSIDDFRNQ